MTIHVDATANIRRMGNATVSIQRLTTVESVTSYVSVSTGVPCIIIRQSKYGQQDDEAIYRGKSGDTSTFNLYFPSTQDVKPGDIVNDGTRDFRLMNDFDYNSAPGFVIAPGVIEET